MVARWSAGASLFRGRAGGALGGVLRGSGAACPLLGAGSPSGLRPGGPGAPGRGRAGTLRGLAASAEREAPPSRPVRPPPEAFDAGSLPTHGPPFPSSLNSISKTDRPNPRPAPPRDAPRHGATG